MSGRKRKKIIDRRFGDCVAIQDAGYKGNNRQIRCRCDCGAEFVTSAQQLRSGLTVACPACRKRKVRQARDSERLQRINKIDVYAVKYTLMNLQKTHIIKGGNGIHSYFDKAKARLAARVIGNAVAVPLSEARMIIS